MGGLISRPFFREHRTRHFRFGQSARVSSGHLDCVGPRPVFDMGTNILLDTVRCAQSFLHHPPPLASFPSDVAGWLFVRSPVRLRGEGGGIPMPGACTVWPSLERSDFEGGPGGIGNIFSATASSLARWRVKCCSSRMPCTCLIRLRPYWQPASASSPLGQAGRK